MARQTKPAKPAATQKPTQASPSAQGFKGASFAKARRPVGEPVSPAAAHARFIPPPPFTAQSLTLPLDAILPGVTDEVTAAGKLVFHSLGDTGGIHGTVTQDAIAAAMQAQIDNADAASKPRFLFHLGDVVYFNGQSENYLSQFYEPYQYYGAPIFAIPGNHDGDTAIRKGDQPDNETTLFGFMENFCSPVPQFLFKHRQTMTQPYCYWKMEAPFVHFIGLYSNVDGLLDARGTSQQQNWFIEQLKTVPADKWLVLAVHHPCYSLDSMHGGYEEILNALDAAFAAADRIPDAVLHGHVHDYQRFSRSYGRGVEIPFIIAGAGGYPTSEASLHKLQDGLATVRLPYQTTRTGVTLAGRDVTNSGFLRLTADPNTLTIDYFSVSFDDPAKVSPRPADSVAVPARGSRKAA
jgi:hypothetical protein